MAGVTPGGTDSLGPAGFWAALRMASRLPQQRPSGVSLNLGSDINTW